MLTSDQVRAVPLFSGLDSAALEQLARTSEDVHLQPGEFAVHEGGERALFAVLAGKLEVVKLIDGVERRLGWRVPGAIFGEVPIALGSPFPAAYRATEPSRVMRVGQRWNTACGDLRRFLTRNQISFDWLTPDSPELATRWPGVRPQDE